MWKGVLVFYDEADLIYFKKEIGEKNTLSVLELCTSQDWSWKDERPSLLVGFMLAKEICGEKFNPLENRVDKFREWCYGFNEKKQIAWQQISKFAGDIGEKLFSHIPYEYLDPSFVDGDTFDSFLESLGTFKVYLNYQSRVVYFTDNKVVYSISIDFCNFCDINTKAIINKLKEKSEKFTEDYHNELLGAVKELYFGYIHMERYMVLLG